MSSVLPVFKSWVPLWLIRITIFMLIVPSLLLFTLSTANAAGAAGYYGIEPADVQYTMIAFYAAVAGFFALERRFFVFTATKEYFLICMVVQILTSYVCFHTGNIYILFIFRFIQGMGNCMSTSICITLIFGSLHSERAREIGYSVFYGLLLCITPIATIITSPILDNFDFNVLYKFIIYAFLPGSVMLLIIMNNVRLSRKIPLYQLDYASFLIYSLLLCTIGYVLLYGQQYYWLQDRRIVWAMVISVALLALLLLRMSAQKRAYIDLTVFKSRNFLVGVFLIFVLYLVRGAFGITNSYFATILGMDPYHIGYILAFNVLGIGLGSLISSRMIIMKRPMRLIWLYGFSLLLAFHVWMWFLFNPQADPDIFYIPLTMQGIGVGLLMTPIIVFMISSVPLHLAGSASAAGVFFRFGGFCASIALTNYYQLKHKTDHFDRFQEQLSGLNGVVSDRINMYVRGLTAKGVAPDQAAKIARGLLNRSIDSQASLRTMMDYYLFISVIIVVVLLVIVLFPFVNRTKINLKSSQPAPASY